MWKKFEPFGEHMIRVKRVYDRFETTDGFRILVDRLWPRGLSKTLARVDLWIKEIAPSEDLRKWFAHDVKKWSAFRAKYEEELKANYESVKALKNLEKEKGTLTLLYAAKDERHNNAIVLLDVLRRSLRKC